jgi:hypothetical protein
MLQHRWGKVGAQRSVEDKCSLMVKTGRFASYCHRSCSRVHLVAHGKRVSCDSGVHTFGFDPETAHCFGKLIDFEVG